MTWRPQSPDSPARPPTEITARSGSGVRLIQIVAGKPTQDKRV